MEMQVYSGLYLRVKPKFKTIGKSIYAYFAEVENFENATFEESLARAQSVKSDTKFDKKHLAWYKFQVRHGKVKI